MAAMRDVRSSDRVYIVLFSYGKTFRAFSMRQLINL